MRLRIILAAAVALVTSVGTVPAAALADAPQQNVTVTISDSGFSPPSVNLGLGGTVTFINQGNNVHTAQTLGGAPFAFTSGGLSAGQSFSVGLTLPGSYPVSSFTDCMGGNNSAQFNCAGESVTVGAAPAPVTAVTAPAPVAPAAPVAAAAPTGLVGSATVTITDTTISPSIVNLATGGTITFMNQGTTLHTATTTTAPPWYFDSGGLNPGQSYTTPPLTTLGTFTYSSYTDCLGGNKSVTFQCNIWTINVGGSAPTTTTSTTSPATASAAPAPAASNTAIVLNEANGFSPNPLNITRGQTVTWTNSGTQVHAVVSDPGINPTFDSGGIDPGKSFSFTFSQSGTYTYSSNTDPVYTTDPTSGSLIKSYRFTGTVVVQ